jgi:hypothetical protein
MKTHVEYFQRSTEPGETTIDIEHDDDQECRILNLGLIAGSYIFVEYALITEAKDD